MRLNKFNSKSIWARRKRLSVLYIERDILISKFGYPRDRSVTRTGYIYSLFFKNPFHIVSENEKYRYKKIESLIQGMEKFRVTK